MHIHGALVKKHLRLVLCKWIFSAAHIVSFSSIYSSFPIRLENTFYNLYLLLLLIICIYLCIYMYVCVYLCMSLCVSLYVYVFLCVYMCADTLGGQNRFPWS